MRFHVLTRGVDRDYGYLAGPPDDQWWDALSDAGLIITTTAQVAVLARRGGWSAVAFGIPSARRTDRIGTRIRYSLMVVDGGPDDGDVAVALVRTLLDTEARAALGAALDEVFGAELVEGLLTRSRPESDVAWDLLPGVLRSVAPQEEPAQGSAETPVPPPWAGPDDEETAAAFVARVGRLAAGEEQGYATTANGLTSLGGIGAAVAEAAPATGTTSAAVLVADAGFDRVTDLRAAVEEASAKKGLTPGVGPRPPVPAFLPTGVPDDGVWTRTRTLWTVASVVCVSAVVLLLFWLFT